MNLTWTETNFRWKEPWDSNGVNFRLDCKECAHTRRGILSVVSSVYDPLGYLAAVILPSKQILQELCQKNCGWNEEVPEILNQQWIRWLADLKELSRFQVSRCLKLHDFGPSIDARLHHFFDGSESGYGTVTYLRLQNKLGDIHMSFILGKARVTPLKPITIPRLAAAVLAVRIDKMIKSELQPQLKSSCFWTDSNTVLKYINNENKRSRTFVANRISVRSITESCSQRIERIDSSETSE